MRLKIFVIVIFSSFLQCRGSLSFLSDNAPIRSIDIKIGPSITCIVRGSIPNPIITWFLNDQELGKHEYENTHDEKTLVSVSTLHKTIGDFDERSVLTCAGLNPKVGEKVFTSRITGNEAESIDVIKIEAKPPIKCTVAFSVTKPIIFWYIGDEIKGADHYETTHDEKRLESVSTFKEKIPSYNKYKFLTCVAINPINGEQIYRSIKHPHLNERDITDKEGVVCHGRGSINPVIALQKDIFAVKAAGYDVKDENDWELSFPHNDNTEVLMCRYYDKEKKKRIVFSLNGPAPFSESDRNPPIEIHTVGITEGSPLICTVAGSRPQPDIVWYANGEEVPRTLYSYNYEEEKLLAKSSLDVQGISANVTCIARNPYFPARVKSATIVVGRETDLHPSRPEIYENPIRCIVRGLDRPTNIIWRIGSERVSEEYINTKYDIKSSTLISILEVSLRKIRGKIVYCSASHPHIPDYIMHEQLTPVSTQRIFDVLHVNIYSKRCEAVGSLPLPVFTWFVDNKKVPEDKYSQKGIDNKLSVMSYLNMNLPMDRFVSVVCIATNPDINLPIWNHTYIYLHSSTGSELLYGEGVDEMNKIGKLGLLYNDFTGQNTAEGKYHLPDDALVAPLGPKNKEEALQQINIIFDAIEKQDAYILEFLDKHLKAQNKFSSDSAIVIKQLFSLEKEIIKIGEENEKINIHRKEILGQLFSFSEDMVSLAGISETFLKPLLNYIKRSVNDLFKPLKKLKHKIFEVADASTGIQNGMVYFIKKLVYMYSNVDHQINSCLSKPITVYKDVFSNVQYALTKYLDHVSDLADQIKDHKNFLKLHSDHYGMLFAGERANEDRLYYALVLLKERREAVECINKLIYVTEKLAGKLSADVVLYFTK